MSDSPDTPPIPVICDRCREEGTAGDDPFTAIADLLTFDPVPRRAHVNGWKPEHQRAFIAALAMTGSPRQAAAALGRWPNGAEQLRKAKGARSFADAWDSALELYREREIFRIKDNLAALADHQEQRDDGGLVETHLRALPPPRHSSFAFAGEGNHADHGGGADFDEPAHPLEELTDALFKKFVIKVRQERTARLAGRIAEADFYLRQISFFEVALELASEDALQAFADLRRGELGVVDIAQTAGTAILDRMRLKAWVELELERRATSPSPPAGEGDSAKAERGEGADEDDPFALDLFPPHLLSDRQGQGVRTEPLPDYHLTHPAEGHTPEQWATLKPADRNRAYEDQYARAAAEEQVRWEQEMLARAAEMKAKLERGEPRPPTDWESWA